MSIDLYELVGEDGTSACPFVWRIKYALAQKNIDYNIERIGFSDIPKILGGKYKSVPVLTNDGEELGDSWTIADHLDRVFADRKALFSCPAERAMVHFFDNWLSGQIVPGLLSLYVLDVVERARPEDRRYYRETREARFGRTLEEVVADRVERLPGVRARFEPLRQAVAAHPFIGGEEPNYADFMAVGVLIWVAGVGTEPLFTKDDAILPWFDRCLGLYGGLGRSLTLPGLM